jgi:hypothetical protein
MFNHHEPSEHDRLYHPDFLGYDHEGRYKAMLEDIQFAINRNGKVEEVFALLEKATKGTIEKITNESKIYIMEGSTLNTSVGELEYQRSFNAGDYAHQALKATNDIIKIVIQEIIKNRFAENSLNVQLKQNKESLGKNIDILLEIIKNDEKQHEKINAASLEKRNEQSGKGNEVNDIVPVNVWITALYTFEIVKYFKTFFPNIKLDQNQSTNVGLNPLEPNFGFSLLGQGKENDNAYDLILYPDFIYGQSSVEAVTNKSSSTDIVTHDFKFREYLEKSETAIKAVKLFNDFKNKMKTGELVLNKLGHTTFLIAAIEQIGKLGYVDIEQNKSLGSTIGPGLIKTDTFIITTKVQNPKMPIQLHLYSILERSPFDLKIEIFKDGSRVNHLEERTIEIQNKKREIRKITIGELVSEVRSAAAIGVKKIIEIAPPPKINNQTEILHFVNAGRKSEVSGEIYNEFLKAVPPIAMSIDGFVMDKPVIGNQYYVFTKKEDKLFMELTTLDNGIKLINGNRGRSSEQGIDMGDIVISREEDLRSRSR